METQTSVKTIDATGLEWFDKVNGNSYFAGSIVINYGMPDEKTFTMPFQYGYGDSYLQEAGKVLREAGAITMKEYKYTDKEGRERSNGFEPLWQYCRDNNIILRSNKHENCKKRELKEFA